MNPSTVLALAYDCCCCFYIVMPVLRHCQWRLRDPHSCTTCRSLPRMIYVWLPVIISESKVRDYFCQHWRTFKVPQPSDDLLEVLLDGVAQGCREDLPPTLASSANFGKVDFSPISRSLKKIIKIMGPSTKTYSTLLVTGDHSEAYPLSNTRFLSVSMSLAMRLDWLQYPLILVS